MATNKKNNRFMCDSIKVDGKTIYAAGVKQKPSKKVNKKKG